MFYIPCQNQKFKRCKLKFHKCNEIKSISVLISLQIVKMLIAIFLVQMKKINRQNFRESKFLLAPCERMPTTGVEYFSTY